MGFAAKVANMSAERWTSRAIQWDPFIHFDGMVPRAVRKQARPKKRWTDEVSCFVTHVMKETLPWTEVAKNTDLWMEYADQYAETDWRTPFAPGDSPAGP